MSNYDYNLSDVWREIKSSDPGTELANILSAAKVMAQTLIPDVDVEIAGMNTPQTGRLKILASAEPLGKEYPVPGARLDVFLGQVIHEAGHHIFSPDTDGITRILNGLRSKNVKSKDFPQLKQLLAIVEDVFVNYRISAFPAYKAYLHRAHQYALKDVDLEAILKPLSGTCTRQNMINGLAVAAITGRMPASAIAENLTALNSMIHQVLEFCLGKISLRKCLLSCWEELSKYPAGLIFAESDDYVSKGKEFVNNQVSQDGSDASLVKFLNRFIEEKVKLADEAARDVAHAIVEKREDLTDMTALLIGYTAQSILIFTPEEDASEVERAWGKTQEVEEQLRRIFQDFRQKYTKHFRGLYSGKVSARRLYRAGYGDPRVFQRRDRPEEMELSLCLLMDCSHSVYDFRALIDEVVTAISNALCKEKAGFMAMGYSERHGQVFIARLFDQETGKVRLDKDKLFGNTPSHEGLAAAIAQLLRLGSNKDRLLIHFTDGQPTSSKREEIPALLVDARSKGIQDYHVALNSRVAEYCKKFYGERVLVIDRIEELPAVIEDILRTELEVKDI